MHLRTVVHPTGENVSEKEWKNKFTKKKVRKKIRKRYYIKNKVLYYSWCCTYATTHREGYSSRHCAEAFLGR